MSQEQTVLESNAIQSLQELYSDDGEESYVDDNLKVKSPAFSGWDSPHKNHLQFYSEQAERSKSNKRAFESPVKAKSTLSHLSENLQRYHFQAFHLKKESVTDEKQEASLNKNQEQILSYQNRKIQFQRNKFNRYTVTEGMKQEEEEKYEEIIQQNGLEPFDYYTDSVSQNTFKKQAKFQDSQYQDQHLSKTSKSFSIYTEQNLTCDSVQTEQSSRYNYRRNSRQNFCSSKLQEHRQQANLSVNNINLYQIEETAHPNKDYKSSFRTIWKRQEKLSKSQSRKGSLEQISEKNLPCSYQSRLETESCQQINQSIEHIDPSQLKENLAEEEKEFQIQKCLLKPETIRLKNICQKSNSSIQKEKHSDFQLFDNSKIQTIFNSNSESENSTQESTRKSSAKSVLLNSNIDKNFTYSKKDLHAIQSNIDLCQKNSKNDQQKHIINQNEESNILVSDLIVPIHNRVKTEQQPRKKQNINRPISNHCSNLQQQNGAAYCDNQMRLFHKVSIDESIQLDQQQTTQNFYKSQVNTNQEINHKSFKQYNIPVTLRSRSLQKRQFNSRKTSNASTNSRNNSTTINDTLLFNIYKPHQVPEIQQKINAYIQSQEEQLKIQYSQNQNYQINDQQNKYIIQSPLKSKNYRKYKPQFKLETQSLNSKSNTLNDSQLGSVLIHSNF
ncbi:hypothetical protein TTHERM_00283320 (macronuclear) [Tetrahymena thermophila SB210]|uniref:Uncharacterized protein n=1 Tax=Tetrahymena thermophila (strain SB210) TaxID=312017 RepID=I7MKA2_TETTS|nr:hypothetical protein TTHERM_00283320 [Tetrahymena thermophila SB210]EAR97943.2 hypothetical protein TTHERM_00283320 [Tetrahymena thermophila SB210]|eukprot:XP_001018188.2 hypothetical protein TTHERM_00283320 [Tetrahymena thermophila SB210]